MDINELKMATTKLNLPIEFGFEKEFLLQAHSKKDDRVYNLNLAQEFLLFLMNTKLPHNHIIVEEYSQCLIEIISKPYHINEVFDGLKKINQLHLFVENKLQKFVKKTYPKLARYYRIALSDEGSSFSNQYLCSDLTILSDQKDGRNIVLPKYKKYIKQYKDITWSFNRISEKVIGTYNHINSFHITFHPTYSNQFSFKDYIKILRLTQTLISRYEKYDRGNKKLFRNGKMVHFKKNIRNIFLKKFLSVHTSKIGANFSIPNNSLNAINYFTTFTKRLLKTAKTKDIDTAYKKWSAFNMRPRVINNQIPGIEIRQFGSNFSRSKSAEKIISDLIKIDTMIQNKSI
ncbi:MAG: hypothetical protein PHH40_00645 [Candidatus Moranbacteria bacterium]|nr:hypothetical protein [Candidatus Moranbacteria bacterium]MDD3964821.1 hypothetical protein [Candidatus Moranbacteria bacterium]